MGVTSQQLVLQPHLVLLSLGNPPPELVVLGHDEVPLALVDDLPGAHVAAGGLVGVAELALGVVGSQGAVGVVALGADGLLEKKEGFPCCLYQLLKMYPLKVTPVTVPHH